MNGWTEYVHPEGQLYYYSSESFDGHEIGLVTDYPLRPANNHFRMVQIINRLRKVLQQPHPILDDPDLRWCEICILISDNTAAEFGYYVANHQAQTLFWLEEVTLRKMGIYEYHEVSRTTASQLLSTHN